MPLDKYVYMHLDIMPAEIVEKYNLHQLADSDGWVYIEIIWPTTGQVTGEQAA